MSGVPQAVSARASRHEGLQQQREREREGERDLSPSLDALEAASAAADTLAGTQSAHVESEHRANGSTNEDRTRRIKWQGTDHSSTLYSTSTISHQQFPLL